MLTVEDYELIRRKLLVDKQSIRAIAKELGHSRKTVAKAARHAQPPGYQRATPRAKPAIDAHRSIIDAWLAQDESRPRKQRHTAARVFERLRDEHGYNGSKVTVRRYVASRRPKPFGGQRSRVAQNFRTGNLQRVPQPVGLG
jgi:transposase